MASGSPADESGEATFRSSPGVPLMYLDQGAGESVILVHGSLTDARYWIRSGHLPRLALSHRVVAPSRRHNHPNPPSDDNGRYSALDDAADLVRLTQGLDIAPVHLVGHSYGAYAALLATLQSPELIRSLVLAEPPLMRLLPELPKGAGVWERFEADVWVPLGAAFEEGGDRAGLDATALWYFGARLAEIDPAWRRDFENSVREWRALTTSRDAFPHIPLDRLVAIQVPTLVLSAGLNSGGMNDMIDEALSGTIPRARRVVVPDVSHEMFLDSPDRLASHLTEFFNET